MKHHATVDEYLRDPVGGYSIYCRRLLWCHCEWLSGMVLFGDIEPHHAELLARGIGANCWRRACLVDLRRIEFIHPTVFDVLAESLRALAPIAPERMPAVALLRPDGFVGLTVAGLPQVYHFDCSVKVFTDPHSALSWLGAIDASSVIKELDEVLSTIVEPTAILAMLRDHLSRSAGKIDLTTASSALGVSRRALQRKLHAANTSFQAEQKAAQVQAAKRLLRDTDQEIKRIAFDVGCSSAAAFSALFRRIVGQSPSVWRSQFAGSRGRGTSHLGIG